MPARRRSIPRLELRFSGNQTRAAEYLDIPRRTLVTKLSVYGIPRPRKVTPVPRT